MAYRESQYDDIQRLIQEGSISGLPEGTQAGPKAIGYMDSRYFKPSGSVATNLLRQIQEKQMREQQIQQQQSQQAPQEAPVSFTNRIANQLKKQDEEPKQVETVKALYDRGINARDIYGSLIEQGYSEPEAKQLFMKAVPQQFDLPRPSSTIEEDLMPANKNLGDVMNTLIKRLGVENQRLNVKTPNVLEMLGIDLKPTKVNGKPMKKDSAVDRFISSNEGAIRAGTRGYQEFLNKLVGKIDPAKPFKPTNAQEVPAVLYREAKKKNPNIKFTDMFPNKKDTKIIRLNGREYLYSPDGGYTLVSEQ